VNNYVLWVRKAKMAYTNAHLSIHTVITEKYYDGKRKEYIQVGQTGRHRFFVSCEASSNIK